MKFNYRENAIMQEAFMTGRVYASLGDKETSSEIHLILKRNCENAIKQAKSLKGKE